MFRYHPNLRFLQHHPVRLVEGHRPVCEEVVQEALLERARGGDHLLARLLRPLYRPQHRRNRSLLGQVWSPQKYILEVCFVQNRYRGH
jgi:hypothetical protein